MDGARGLFSTTGSMNEGDFQGDEAVRTRTVSAGTRLRQKPAAGVATPEDFFASLGVDTTSCIQSRGNSSISSTTVRPASASGVGSSTLTPSPSVWRPPPIGGLRVTPPPPPISAVGSLSVANVSRSVTTTTTTSSATSTISVNRERLGGSTGNVTAETTTVTSVTATKTSARPMQLFSMEDAEELYSDDGWDCDSPSTVLSNPTDEIETTSTTVAMADTAAAQPTRGEVVWGGDDDAFASPAENALTGASKISATGAIHTKVESTMHQAVPATMVEGSGTESFARTPEPSYDTKSPVEHARTVTAALPPPATTSSSSFTTRVTNSTFEIKSHSAAGMPLDEADLALEQTQFTSKRPPLPSTTVSSTFFSAQPTHNASEMTSSQTPPHAATFIESSVSHSPCQQDDQWEDDWDQQKQPAISVAETKAVNDTTTVYSTAVTTTTTTIQEGTFGAPPVELTSPGGAAGEFWGDGDESELFDHDENADEEWDESIKDPTNASENLTLRLSESKNRVESAAHASSSEDTTIPLPHLSPSSEVSTTHQGESTHMAQEAVSASNYFISEHSEETSQEQMINQLPENAQSSTIAASSKQNPVTPPTVHESAVPSHSIETSQMMDQEVSLGTEGSPFSSAITEPTNRDNDPSVFPEAPRSARFLHTPTGTGGPFGRVSSPRDNENSSLSSDMTGAVINEAMHDSMAFAGGVKDEAPGSYTESSVHWDPRSFHSSRHIEMPSGDQAREDDHEARHDSHHGLSDNEERDSVVSFSGENSFFSSTGRPSSLYGGSQSSFASHRMYQSSTASTDHDGVSIASLGVSSAGATFGGSERVSESGAFSDGTASETPSMVDSSNASTAFGTDFPSVSEGQFSAPGTTIGGSDNASDEGFSDGETTSMCGSVNTNPRFVSEFSISSGHYVTETIERRGMPESFGSSAPDPQTMATFDESTPAAAPTFEDDDTSLSANPFASSSSTLSFPQHAPDAPPATVLTNFGFDQQSGGAAQEKDIQSAASLFGATAGADVPNPFVSFGALPSAAEAKPINEHELPTSDAGDLFSSGPSSSGFERSFAQPAQDLYSSSYQTHGESYNRAGSGANFTTQTSSFNPTQNRLSFNDRPAGGVSISSSFESQRSNKCDSADMFASRSAQLEFDNSRPSADSVFGDGGGYNDNSSVKRGAFSHFSDNVQASASDTFSQSNNNIVTAADHFGQQSSTISTSQGMNQSYSEYDHPVTTAYSGQDAINALNYEQQPAVGGDGFAQTNTSSAQSYRRSEGVAATTSGGFGHSSHQSSTNSFNTIKAQREASGSEQNYFDRSAPGALDNYSQQSAVPAFSSTSGAQQSFSTQQIGQISTAGAPDNSSHYSAAEAFGSASPAQSSYSRHQDNSYAHYGKGAVHGPASSIGDHVGSSPSASIDAFFGRSPLAHPSASSTGGERVTKQRPNPGTPNNSGRYSTAEAFGSASPAQSSYSRQQDNNVSSAQPSYPQQDNSYAHYGKGAVHGPARSIGGHVGSSSIDAFFGRSPTAHPSSSDIGGQFVTTQTHPSYDERGVHASGGHANSYFESCVPGTSAASSASYSRQQPQQVPEQQHADTGCGYHGDAVQSQPQGPGYNVADNHNYGTVTGYGGYGQTGTAHASPTPIVKTSSKFKDPCVAPSSCLASFGFGGNVVTMFPKRKVRLNIAGNSFRNSPRGASVPSDFDSGGNGELRKGPVNVYCMNQLHPKDDEFEQMDVFPGPLTEDVSDEAILEYLDDCLKRSEAPTSTGDAEDENDRLLLGVLRILATCNGKLRSDPGTFDPSDPESPEAKLIALLSESSKRHNGNQPPSFPAPRRVQSATHPDLLLKHANDLRELLLVGDRKGAVSCAVTAHMWPEAMLIASFTDKEEYRRVLRAFLEDHYATGDPCRALFMSFADQQEKSVQEPKRLLSSNVQLPAESLILSSWVSHAQILVSNRTADTNKILTELGDRLWGEVNAVTAAHMCYLLAGIQVDAPMPSSKMALLGGDHRTPAEARFYVSPAAVQRTEIYEWAQKHAKGASANLMIPFQGYKLIYAMLLADHGKLITAFKYVTSMLTVVKAVTATTKPGTSMYLEGMKNQLTVLDDRLRQHLGQDRVASVAAATSRGGDSKQNGKWGLGSALSIMGKIVNRVVEGSESATASLPSPSTTTPGGLYAKEAIPAAANYPSTSSVTSPALSSASPYPQQQALQTPPPSSHGPSTVPASFYGHATPPVSQSSAPGSSNGYKRASATPPAGPYSRPGIAPSGPLSGNGCLGPQQQSSPFAGNEHFASQHQQSSSGPFSGNGRPSATGPFSNSGPGPQTLDAAPLMRSQQLMEPPGSHHSTHSNSSSSGMTTHSASQYLHQQQHQQPPSSQTSQHSQGTPSARSSFQKPHPLDVTGNASSFSEPKTLADGLAAGLAAEMAASLPSTDAPTMSGPASDKGKASPKFKGVKKPGRSKTPPPSGSGKGSGWLSGLSSFIATKMNPEAKVAKLGEQMEAYFDEDAKRWVFPGETAPEEAAKPSAPPTGPLPSSAPGSSATGVPPVGTSSAPGSISSGLPPSNDPLAALMAPPPSHMLMKKDPLAAMMAPPPRAGVYSAHRGGSSAQRKPPRPQFAVFKPTAASGEQGG